MPKTKKPTKKDYIHAVGRRKTATARVRLYPKKGDIIVNDKPIAEYFPGRVWAHHYMTPLRITETADKVSFTIKVTGSGRTGQIDAVVHGISRALSEWKTEEYRPLLKSAGLLTRDPRQKERRKVGTGGKARRKKQSPKR